MAKINIKGDIVTNEYKRFYDYLSWDSTCPKEVQDIIDAAEADERIDVYINSPGGFVSAGTEIYSALRGDPRAHIHIVGMACSAASVIAMAADSDITPPGQLMVHCASVSGVSGNHHDMKRAEQALRSTDAAIANAYVVKSGQPLEEIMRLMERETWLTANECVEMGLIDRITEEAPPLEAVAASGGIRMTDEVMEMVRREMAKKKADDEARAKLLEDLDSFGV